MQQQLIVVGGGAAGFFCAVNAARLNPALKVTILEKSSKLLSKVKVSGGGRCNVTHACFDIPELVKRYPRGQQFLKKAFHWFGPQDTIDWFAERGVTLKTEADGRMFPVTDSSQTIIDCLLCEANKYKADILLNSDVQTIGYTNNHWQLQLQNGRQLTAAYLCIASGGHPKLQQFGWLAATGHNIEPPIPSLFTFNMPGNPITQLMGVSVEWAQVKVQSTKLQSEGPLLITHWGMSGPAVLKLSAYGAKELAAKNYDFTILVNWLPGQNEQTIKERLQQLRNGQPAQKIHGKNAFGLPNRLWTYLLQLCQVGENLRWADLTAKQQNQLSQLLTAQQFAVKGKTTFKEEFVTCGGIQLNELDPNTLQSKKMPHLFFAGEVIDVDGITGGFNFQNAWTTGWIAAKAIAGER
jgi:hypothetical protein